MTDKTLHKLMDLTGRTALITGAAGHIGSAMADALAELGANIVVMDVSQEKCNVVAQALHSQHRIEALPLAVDLKNTDMLRTVYDVVKSQFGRLDILINCAAMVGTAALQGWVSSFSTQSVQAWRDALEINLTAPFVLTQSCAPLLAASGHGSIINVGSIYGLVGPDWSLYAGTKMGNPAAYGASKGGLIQFTRWLATTLAPQVRVNSITPGGVFRDTQEPFLSRYVSRVPLGRMAAEEDFKGAAAYLASDLSAYVTGHSLVVDGGWTAW